MSLLIPLSDKITGRHRDRTAVVSLRQSTPQQVADHFKSCGVAIEEGPGEKLGAMGTIVSVYCRDPDGNLIEVSSYKLA